MWQPLPQQHLAALCCVPSAPSAGVAGPQSAASTAPPDFPVAGCAGSFADKVSRQTAAATALAASVAEQIAIRQTETKTQSHTAGFEVSPTLLHALADCQQRNHRAGANVSLLTGN